jgi:hypothetical protein
MSEEPQALDFAPYPAPSAYESALGDLWDGLAMTLLRVAPGALPELYRQVKARSDTARRTMPADDRAVVYQTTMAVALQRIHERLTFPDPPPPEPPEGTVSLAAARARRGRGTSPTGGSRRHERGLEA